MSASKFRHAVDDQIQRQLERLLKAGVPSILSATRAPAACAIREIAAMS
jgi:hypothetical protein